MTIPQPITRRPPIGITNLLAAPRRATPAPALLLLSALRVVALRVVALRVVALRVVALMLAPPTPTADVRAQAPSAATLAPAALLADSARLAIESAYSAGRPEAVADARGIAERGLQQQPADALLLHYQAYAFFREAQLRRSDAARPLLERARSAIEHSIAVRDLAESRAILSATLGNLIGASPFRAMRFGRASFSEIDKAVALEPENPRVWMLKGVGQLFAPSIFGGGVDKAETSLRKAAAQFTADRPAPPLPAWGRAEVHGWLAIVLARQKKGAEARAELERGLALEPQDAFLLLRAKPAVDSVAPPRVP